MLKLDATDLDYKELNERIRASVGRDVEIKNVFGQRYIASGAKSGRVMIHGVPGNDTASFLDGAEVEIFGSAQDATGDTMNEGTVIIHGSVGDAAGYAMRGGRIYIKGNAGYRAGIHMKAYKEKQPLLVIGGSAGSFLGEYQAGGTIIVLGIGKDGRLPVGYFCGTGMHGGQIILRSNELPFDLPPQVSAKEADEKDKELIKEKIIDFCTIFSIDINSLMKDSFFILTPNTASPYKRLYTNI